MTENLSETYFVWLYSQIGAVKLRNRSKSYRSLASQLHSTPFVWFVPNDDNRVEDGRDLRLEFLNESGIGTAGFDRTDMGCSMLELLIILSRKAAFDVDGWTKDWFWHFIGVLELTQFNDLNYDSSAERVVEDVMNRVIFRTYAPDGSGGLFPLQQPASDQREVELWYQLSAYLLELM